MATVYNLDAQWIDDCPACHKHKCLVVYEVTLVANGRKHYPITRLTQNGFEVDPSGDLCEMRDQSTCDEKVRCARCGKCFKLADLECCA